MMRTNKALPGRVAVTSRRGLRRLVVVMAAAAVLTAGVGLAEPAEAAGSGTATVCFVNPNGRPWTGNTRSQYWSNGGWVNGSTVVGTSNGCRQWTAGEGNYVRFAGSQTFTYGLHGQAFTSSWSSYATITAGSSTWLGTYVVNQTSAW